MERLGKFPRVPTELLQLAFEPFQKPRAVCVISVCSPVLKEKAKVSPSSRANAWRGSNLAVFEHLLTFIKQQLYIRYFLLVVFPGDVSDHNSCSYPFDNLY